MSKDEPSAGAMRAAKEIIRKFQDWSPFMASGSEDAAERSLTRIIDRETGLKELIEALDEKITNIITDENGIGAVEFKSDPQLDKRLVKALSRTKGTT